MGESNRVESNRIDSNDKRLHLCILIHIISNSRDDIVAPALSCLSLPLVSYRLFRAPHVSAG